MSGPRFQRTKRENHRLIGYQCQSCDWVSFPEKKRTCKRCGDAPATFEEVSLKKTGIIQSFVVQERLPNEFETPQPIAIVDIPSKKGEGAAARVFALLTETELRN